MGYKQLAVTTKKTIELTRRVSAGPLKTRKQPVNPILRAIKATEAP
jgi:hypothetical protein